MYANYYINILNCINFDCSKYEKMITYRILSHNFDLSALDLRNYFSLYFCYFLISISIGFEFFWRFYVSFIQFCREMSYIIIWFFFGFLLYCLAFSLIDLLSFNYYFLFLLYHVHHALMPFLIWFDCLQPWLIFSQIFGYVVCGFKFYFYLEFIYYEVMFNALLP